MIPSVHVLKIVFFILLAVLSTALFIETPVVFPDALRGIEAMYQYANGGRFNTLAYPDVAGGYAYFISWWTPGQWMIPYFFIVFLGISASLGLSLIVFLFTALGLIGYFRLFRRLTGDEQIIWFSMVLLITNQLFFWHYMVYFGGDLFVFALLPFYLIVVLKLAAHFSMIRFLLLLILSLVGFYAKGTFVIYAFAALATLFLFERKRYTKSLLHSAMIPFGGLIFFAIIYFSFLAVGETPGGTMRTGIYENIQDSILADLLYPLGSVLGVLTRLSILLQKVQFHTGFGAQILLLIPFALTFWFVRKITERRNTHVFIMLVFSTCVLMVFTLLYLTDRAVSYDMRHFAALSFVFIPFFIEEINTTKVGKWLIGGVVLMALIDVGYLGYKIVQHRNQFVLHEGIRISESDAQIVELVKTYKLSEKDLIVVEEYWGLIPLFSHPKICIKQKNGEWYINSGMELIKGEERFKLNEDKYHRIIVISRNNQISWFPQSLQVEHLEDLDEWKVAVFQK